MNSPPPCLYAPRITFQDTNIVGNVYFLSYFRWQAECYDLWLRSNRPEQWEQLRLGRERLLTTHWSTRFEDPFGATVGDEVTLKLNVAELPDGSESTSVDIFRHSGAGTARIATSTRTVTTSSEFERPDDDTPTGPCYTCLAICPLASDCGSLELLGWQGKCRELFLADHAVDTLQLVATQKLILQTTAASVDLICLPPLPLDQVRVEMRLATLKCGQLGVRFDYFSEEENGEYVRFATGRQTMSSKHRSSSSLVPCPLPADLLSAQRQFTNSEQFLAKIDDILRFSAHQQRDAGIPAGALSHPE